MRPCTQNVNQISKKMFSTFGAWQKSLICLNVYKLQYYVFDKKNPNNNGACVLAVCTCNMSNVFWLSNTNYLNRILLQNVHKKNADSVKCKYRVNCFKQKNVKCQNEFFEKIHNRVCRCACDEFLIPINVFIGKSILSMSKQFVNTFYLLNKTMRRSEPQFAKFES